MERGKQKKVDGFTSRVPLRSENNANANGGLVCANANNAGANSNTNNGVRLTLSTAADSSQKKFVTLRSPRDGQCKRRETGATATASGEFGKPEHNLVP